MARGLTSLGKHFSRTTSFPPPPPPTNTKTLRHPIQVKLHITDPQNHQEKEDDKTERERQQLKRGDRLHLSLHDKTNFKGNDKINKIINKKIKNTEEAPFGIPGASTEHENDLRVKPIVERDFFPLKTNRYSVTKLIRYSNQSVP